MKDVSIIDLDEKYCIFANEIHYMSGHTYLNSSLKTDNSCENCDGTRCSICRKKLQLLII